MHLFSETVTSKPDVYSLSWQCLGRIFLQMSGSVFLFERGHCFMLVLRHQTVCVRVCVCAFRQPQETLHSQNCFYSSSMYWKIKNLLWTLCEGCENLPLPIHPSVHRLFPPSYFLNNIVSVEHRDFMSVLVHVCHLDSINLHQLEDTWELGRRVCPGKKNRNKKKKGRGRISIMISSLFFDIVAGLSGELCVCVCWPCDTAYRPCLWDLIVYKTSKPLHEDETQKSFKFLKGFIFDRNPTKAHKSVVSFSKVYIIIIAGKIISQVKEEMAPLISIVGCIFLGSAAGSSGQLDHLNHTLLMPYIFS